MNEGTAKQSHTTAVQDDSRVGTVENIQQRIFKDFFYHKKVERNNGVSHDTGDAAIEICHVFPRFLITVFNLPLIHIYINIYK